MPWCHCVRISTLLGREPIYSGMCAPEVSLVVLQTVQEAMSEESASDSEESAQATPRLGDNVIVVKGGRTRGDRVQRGRASRGRAQKGGSLDDSTMERFIRFLDEAGKKLFSKGPQTPVYNPSFPVVRDAHHPLTSKLPFGFLPCIASALESLPVCLPRVANPSYLHHE